MKLINTILILAMIFCGCNSNKNKGEDSQSIEKIEIKEELEWNKLEGFINQFAETKPNLEAGKDSIIKFIKENFSSFNTDFLVDLDIASSQKEFVSWVKVPLLNAPPDKEIAALYFGLFTSSDPQLSETGEELTVLYIAGSKISPEADSLDWATEPEYFPDAGYCLLTSFSVIDKELSRYKNTTDLEQILFNGITNLILVNSLNELNGLINRSDFYVGSGFDSGDCFIIGKPE